MSASKQTQEKKVLREFLIGAVIFSLITTAGYLIAPIEVRFIKTLTNNPSLIGATFGVGSIALAFFSIWIGRLSDKFGRDNFILWGCVASIIFPLLYASTYNVYQYMGVKFIWAFASASTGPILIAYLQDLLKNIKKQGQYIGIMYSVQSLLGAIAQFAGGYLSDRSGLAAPYFLMSIIFLLAAILSFSTLRSKKSSATHHDKDFSPRDFFFGIKYILKKPALVFYTLINAAFGINWGIKIMLWPLIIFSFTGKDLSTGAIFATMGFVAFVALFFTGKFVDKVGPFKVGLVSAFVLGSSGMFLATTDSLSMFWFFAAIFAIGEALNGPYQAVLLTNYVNSKYRGEILGIDSVLDKLFQTIAPFLAGFLLHIMTPQKILLIFISFFWIALFCGYFIYNKELKHLKS
ncbi:MFS transporter [bacterium]|jgi:MFS family permease|nr:MFS transporter [bacterium]MBT4251440.1 MFS transporter [bacterium]MBT4597414.1 MFS transporter [bacterium]MBT6754253.1 MFS transporter [bacterium]MBT7037579.1 MFS transporter [bacterium]